jgi:hypothetical protein
MGFFESQDCTFIPASLIGIDIALGISPTPAAKIKFAHRPVFFQNVLLVFYQTQPIFGPFGLQVGEVIVLSESDNFSSRDAYANAAIIGPAVR